MLSVLHHGDGRYRHRQISTSDGKTIDQQELIKTIPVLLVPTSRFRSLFRAVPSDSAPAQGISTLIGNLFISSTSSSRDGHILSGQFSVRFSSWIFLSPSAGVRFRFFCWEGGGLGGFFSPGNSDFSSSLPVYCINYPINSVTVYIPLKSRVLSKIPGFSFLSPQLPYDQQDSTSLTHNIPPSPPPRRPLPFRPQRHHHRLLQSVPPIRLIRHGALPIHLPSAWQLLPNRLNIHLSSVALLARPVHLRFVVAGGDSARWLTRFSVCEDFPAEERAQGGE